MSTDVDGITLLSSLTEVNLYGGTVISQGAISAGTSYSMFVQPYSGGSTISCSPQTIPLATPACGGAGYNLSSVGVSDLTYTSAGTTYTFNPCRAIASGACYSLGTAVQLCIKHVCERDQRRCILRASVRACDHHHRCRVVRAFSRCTTTATRAAVRACATSPLSTCATVRPQQPTYRRPCSRRPAPLCSPYRLRLCVARRCRLSPPPDCPSHRRHAVVGCTICRCWIRPISRSWTVAAHSTTGGRAPMWPTRRVQLLSPARSVSSVMSHTRWPRSVVRRRCIRACRMAC